MADILAFLKWYVALAFCGALALPLTFKFFHRLPDRGYAFARPVGLLVSGYFFWLLGSLGFLRNDVPSLLLSAALSGGLGLWWLKRSGLDELRAWLRSRWGTVLGVELVFLGAFALMAWVRSLNPDIVATEKPMEYMFINSILRSDTMPPHDAWLSGHSISYYYFGYIIVAALAQVTGTAGEVAFNLGLALLFALTAVGALGVVMNLVELAARKAADSRTLLRGFWPGLLAPLFVLVVGNFYGVLALAYTNYWFPRAKVLSVRYYGGPDDPANFGDSALDPAIARPATRGMQLRWDNVWDWLDLRRLSDPQPAPETSNAPFNWNPGFWWWFDGARILQDRSLFGDNPLEIIDEVPAFSFVLGDMHPHVLNLPFVILAVAVALQWLLWAAALETEPPALSTAGIKEWGRLMWPHGGQWLFSAVLLGGLGFLNIWDFPFYFSLATLALIIGLGLHWGWHKLINHWALPLLLAGAVGLGCLLAYLPFYLSFQSQAGGILPNIIYPTRFQQTIVMFGPVLVGVALFCGWLAWRERSRIDWRVGWMTAGAVVAALIAAAVLMALVAWRKPDLRHHVMDALRLEQAATQPLAMGEAVWLVIQKRLVDSLATLFPAALIALAVGAAAAVLKERESGRQPGGGETAAGGKGEERPWRSKRRAASASAATEGELHSPAVLLVLLMVLIGALLALAPDYVYLRDYFGWRMNTVFKFYFQTWVLWALASAFGSWYILASMRWGGRLVVGLVTILSVGAGLLYTVPAVMTRDGETSFDGLDGMAYFANSYPDDWATIQWFRRNVAGAPVIAEAIGGQYWIEGRFSRISMGTGLPTVMGWPGHEEQWRGRYFHESPVAQREADIRTLYTTSDWNTARRILDKYDIQYVIVSDLERSKYAPGELDKFAVHLRAVFESGEVTVYQR